MAKPFQPFPPASMILSPCVTRTGDPSASVQGINTTPLADGAVVYCEQGTATYRLDKADSTTPPDGVTVIKPTAGQGRWKVFGAASGGGGPLAIGEDSLAPAIGVISVTADGVFHDVPKDVDFTPLQVTFPAWNSGDVLEVSYQIDYSNGYAINTASAQPVVSLDGGGTWLPMPDASSSWWAGGGDITPALSFDSGLISGFGLSAVNAAGPVLVRLQLALQQQNGSGTQLVNAGQQTSQTNLICKRWPASLFVQGPSYALP